MAHSARSLPLLAPSCSCQRLLQRPQSAPKTLTASFATTSPRHAVARPSKVVHKRGVKASRGSKKAKRPVETSRRPGDDLKNFRKRIVLSNANALEVDLTDLDKDTRLGELRGSMVGLPAPLIERLKAAEAFKPRQSWGMFKRPAVVVSAPAVELAGALEAAARPGKAERRVLVGEKGSGKSVLLLLAMAHAFLRDWVVISIPEAMYLVNAHTAYSPIANTSPQQYSQKTYTAELLQRIVRSNPVLATLKPADPRTFPTAALMPPASLPTATLADLVTRAAAADPDMAWPTFEALWAELTAPGRPPVLLALDGLSKAMQASAYRDAAFEPVHAHDLSLVSWFVAHLSGASALPNGGAVLAATSGSNTPANPTLDLQLRRLEALQAQAEGSLRHDPATDPLAPYLAATGQASSAIPLLDAYTQYDQRVLDALGGTDGQGAPRVARVGGLARDEARGVMEYWARSGMVRARVDAQLVGQKWSVAGGGVLRELEKGCFRMRI